MIFTSTYYDLGHIHSNHICCLGWIVGELGHSKTHSCLTSYWLHMPGPWPHCWPLLTHTVSSFTSNYHKPVIVYCSSGFEVVSSFCNLLALFTLFVDRLTPTCILTLTLSLIWITWVNKKNYHPAPGHRYSARTIDYRSVEWPCAMFAGVSQPCPSSRSLQDIHINLPWQNHHSNVLVSLLFQLLQNVPPTSLAPLLLFVFALPPSSVSSPQASVRTAAVPFDL